MGSSQAPERGLLARRPGDQAVEEVGQAGGEEDDQRPAAVAVHQQDHEAGISSIRIIVSWFAGREDRTEIHSLLVFASASSFDTASTRFGAGDGRAQLERVASSGRHHAGATRRAAAAG